MDPFAMPPVGPNGERPEWDPESARLMAAIAVVFFVIAVIVSIVGEGR